MEFTTYENLALRKLLLYYFFSSISVKPVIVSERFSSFSDGLEPVPKLEPLLSILIASALTLSTNN